MEQPNSKLGKLFAKFSETNSKKFPKDLILRKSSMNRSFQRNDSSINEDASKEKLLSKIKDDSMYFIQKSKF